MKKVIWLISLIALLAFSACSAGAGIGVVAPTSASTPAPAPANAYASGNTVAPAVPTAVPPTANAQTGSCTKHGTVAWQNDNQQSGALYGEAPVGGLEEACGVVAQTWTSQGGTERFVFFVPAHSVAWISGHRGGTGWYFDPAQDVTANLQKQVSELLDRDGPIKTTVANLGVPAQTFRLVTRFCTQATSTP